MDDFSSSSVLPTFSSDNASHACGSFALVLHAHLPYVLSHGKWPHGTDWLCEAAAESYIPLLNVLHRLLREGVEPRLTLGLTPILCEQLTDERFVGEFEAYCGTKIMIARANALEFEAQEMPQFRDLAAFWEQWYSDVLRDFAETYECDIIGAFKKLQDAGHLEIITCAATHAYLPLLGTDESVKAQIALGVETYRAHFERQPRGLWLPECAYHPRGMWTPPAEMEAPYGKPYLRKGTDEFLGENRLDYFIADAHSLCGEPDSDEERTRQSLSFQIHQVQSAPQSHAPVAVFSRHAATVQQLWSDEQGYPAAGEYLDSHARHYPGGHRLWRVTDLQTDAAQKQPYDPSGVASVLDAQAARFCEAVRDSLKEYAGDAGTTGLICAPYDAELFGHRWFEGPQWLYRVLKTLWHDEEIDLTTGGRYLDAHPVENLSPLPSAAWSGHDATGGWINENTSWAWREIYVCEQIMSELAQRAARTLDEELLAVLEECARELLLMEASDWQVLLSTDTARDYARMRCEGHINLFYRLVELAENVMSDGALAPEERDFLTSVTQRDSPFPRIDLSLWARAGSSAEEPSSPE